MGRKKIDNLDLTNKGNWTLDDSAAIAAQLRFVHSNEFIANLELFIVDTVREADITEHLSSLAIGFFNDLKVERL